jgi:transposase
MSSTSSHAPQLWVGIDISKRFFDACLLRQEGKPLSRKFDNTAGGFSKLLQWVKSHAEIGQCHFCMEATGTYGLALAFFLVEAGLKVSIINPFRIKYAAMSKGIGNKTDAADALLIADYCRKENPPLWRAAEPEVRKLVALLRRLQNIKDQLVQETNRLSEPGVLKEIRHSLGKSIRFLKREITTLESAIDEHIVDHPRLKSDRDLLISIPGVSATTAHWILAELADVEQFPSAQSAAAYAGLAPQEYRSGTSVRKPTHLSKQGNAHLRRALYMPALSAMRHNPLIKAFYERLVAKGKPRMVAVGAAMRKLIMIAYGILKSRRSFTTTLAETPS